MEVQKYLFSINGLMVSSDCIEDTLTRKRLRSDLTHSFTLLKERGRWYRCDLKCLKSQSSQMSKEPCRIHELYNKI